MSQTAVLVWLSASSLLPTFHAELSAFADSRLLRLEAPRENAAPFRTRSSTSTSAYAPDVVIELEAALEEARAANASLEPARALSALDGAQSTLRAHPELPQSAWLMAEILQLSAAVESSVPGGADAALALRQRAAGLEGPRAEPFSDSAAASVATLPSRPLLTLSLTGLEPDDAVEWDGVRIAAAPASVAASEGEHHARVSRNGRLLWAGWTTVLPSASELRVPVPETVACSLDDIGQGRFEAGRAIAAPHARCDNYVLARPRAAGGIEIAQCERAVCGKVVVWAKSEPRRAVADERKKPLWPYAVAATAGALVVTGLVLWRAGVFDRDDGATRQVWTYSGPEPKPMSFRF